MKTACLIQIPPAEESKKSEKFKESLGLHLIGAVTDNKEKQVSEFHAKISDLSGLKLSTAKQNTKYTKLSTSLDKMGQANIHWIVMDKICKRIG